MPEKLQPSPPRRRGSLWLHVALAFIATLIVIAFIGQPSSGSMLPTLEPGDRLVVNRLAFVGSDPSPGDIVVFRPGPEWGEQPVTHNRADSLLRWIGETTGLRPYVLVKRIIASSGQTVECCDTNGRITVDGVPLDESFVVEDFPFVADELDCTTIPMSMRCFPSVVVPERAYLVLGDNRANSDDSAFLCRGTSHATESCWRWVRRESIVGKVGPIIWPVSRWGNP